MTKPTTFEQFWPDYLRAHCDRRTRALHVAGTSAGLICAVLFLVTFHPAWLVAAVASAYGFAWAGHLVFEKNAPATFSHPLWSLRGDLRMFRLTLTGRIDEEVARVGCQPDGETATARPHPGAPDQHPGKVTKEGEIG